MPEPRQHARVLAWKWNRLFSITLCRAIQSILPKIEGCGGNYGRSVETGLQQPAYQVNLDNLVLRDHLQVHPAIVPRPIERRGRSCSLGKRAPLMA